MIAISIVTMFMTSLIDITFGILPDATVLYFIPITLGTMFVSRRFGFLMVGLATVLGHWVKISIGIPTDILLLIDAAMHLLAYSFIAITISITMEQFAKTEVFEKRILQDLALAKEIHESSFRPLPKSLMGMDIGCRVAFAKELGGDYYHFHLKTSEYSFVLQIYLEKVCQRRFLPLF
jgi:hypothetical protein